MKHPTAQLIAAGAALALTAGSAHAATLLHHWTFDTDGSGLGRLGRRND